MTLPLSVFHGWLLSTSGCAVLEPSHFRVHMVIQYLTPDVSRPATTHDPKTLAKAQTPSVLSGARCGNHSA